jgi:hypothetical protein
VRIETEVILRMLTNDMLSGIMTTYPSKIT